MQPIQNKIQTVIIRHKKENRKKCSLTPLENRDDFLFLPYPNTPQFDFSNCILLDLNAPVLSKEDLSLVKNPSLLLLDSTWKYLPKIRQNLPQNILARSLPNHFQTAYPRKQTDCDDPKRGLSSIEAIYIAYDILGLGTKGLLDHYHFKETFLSLNGFKTQKALLPSQ